MKFEVWLEGHLRKDKGLLACRRSGDTVELIEKKNKMALLVESVPCSVVVIYPEAAKQWSLFPDDKPKGWAKRCDYLLVGRLDGKYFAVFVELKLKISDGDGKEQLRWSQPLFHYLLSVFNVDRQTTLEASEFTVKYWQMGQDISTNYFEGAVLIDEGDVIYLKDTLVLEDDQESYFPESHNGLTIHNRIAVPISLRELVET